MKCSTPGCGRSTRRPGNPDPFALCPRCLARLLAGAPAPTGGS